MEAIKGAVQHGLGVAFVSVTAIQKELDLGLATHVRINGVRLFRTLCLVSNPRREYSRMARKFMVEVFGMSSTPVIANVPEQRNKDSEKGEAALPHVMPAARPWEGTHSLNGAVHGKPILQLVQSSNSDQVDEPSGSSR